MTAVKRPRAIALAGGMADTYVGGIDVTHVIDRFRAKYEVDSATGCWLWISTKNKDGYGSFWNGERFPGKEGKRGGPKMVLAHRWSYAEFRGPIPVGLNVLHHCDTPACVNPDHHFPGTQAENVADCAKKGRRNQRRLKKLTIAQVGQIRSEYEGRYGQLAELGRKYGVTYQTIRRHVHSTL